MEQGHSALKAILIYFFLNDPVAPQKVCGFAASPGAPFVAPCLPTISSPNGFQQLIGC